MSLGGPSAVRAYPVGEAGGDEGWMTQLELRYTTGAWAPYVFADAGETSTNAKPWAAGTNKRNISGAGVGTRYTSGGWSVDAVLAWRTDGGKPQSDTQASDPQGWLTLAYKF
jgi:hemolysin activation/secretion protein